MYRTLIAVLTAASIFATSAHGQGTTQPLLITFYGQPEVEPGTGRLVQSYFESGMWFRPIGPSGQGNLFQRHGGGVSTSPENGTAYVRTALGESLQFSFISGYLFSLVSVDVAEYSTVVPDAVTVPFIGYRPDGSTVMTSFTTDGVIDGTGSLADFETFTFGPEFSGLARVEIPTFGWSLDNLVVAVPEPSTVTLFGGALICLGFVFRRSARPDPSEFT